MVGELTLRELEVIEFARLVLRVDSAAVGDRRGPVVALMHLDLSLILQPGLRRVVWTHVLQSNLLRRSLSMRLVVARFLDEIVIQLLELHTMLLTIESLMEDNLVNARMPILIVPIAHVRLRMRQPARRETEQVA